MIVKILIAPLLFLSLLSITAIAQPLVPDSTFNTYGYLQQSTRAANKVMHFSDGSVLVGGMKGDSLALWKYKPNGTPDAAFGNNGVAGILIPSSVIGSLEVRSLLQQRDKKIVVMANAEKQTSSNGNTALNAILLARFNINGTPDASFNGTGYLAHKPLSGYEYIPQALAIDSTGTDDRFYVACFVSPTGGWGTPEKWSISKYKTNGTPDSSFNANGVLQGIGSDINAGTQRLCMIQDLKVMPTGRLLVAGGHVGSDSAWFLFRLKPNGNFDSTYATNGRVYRHVPFPTSSNAFSGGHILSDGSAVLFTHAQYTVWGSSYDSFFAFIVRHNPDGTPVASYGNNGVLTVSYLGAGTLKMDFDSSKRMLISWFRSNNNTSQRIHLKRFHLNGTVDTSFGGNGTGEVISEPILNDVYYNRSSVADIVFTPGFKGLSLLANRSSPSINSGFAYYRYKFVLPKQPQGIKGIQQLQASIFPVPATGILYIDAREKIQSLRLINMAGQTVLEETGINNSYHPVNTMPYPTGHYLLQVNGTKSRLNKTIEIR